MAKLLCGLYLLSCFIRVGAIIPLFYSPFWGWLLIVFIDTFDYNLPLFGGMTWPKYQKIDKSLDILNRSYLLLSAYLIFPSMVFAVCAGFFVFRLIGDVLYFFTKSEKYLFFFPNFIEFFYIAYILTGGIFISLAYVVPLKLAHEYLVHIRGWVDPILKKYIINHPEHLRKM
jgi:hypothetical protein